MIRIQYRIPPFAVWEKWKRKFFGLKCWVETLTIMPATKSRYAFLCGFSHDWKQISTRRFKEVVALLVLMLSCRWLVHLSEGLQHGWEPSLTFSIMAVGFAGIAYTQLHLVAGLELAIDSFFDQFFPGHGLWKGFRWVECAASNFATDFHQAQRIHAYPWDLLWCIDALSGWDCLFCGWNSFHATRPQQWLSTLAVYSLGLSSSTLVPVRFDAGSRSHGESQPGRAVGELLESRSGQGYGGWHL